MSCVPLPLFDLHPNTRVILGPPGTGKTTRLMRLLEHELAAGTPPGAIGFVSFTRAAVTEAKERAVAKTGLDPEGFNGFRTVHSQAYALIGRDLPPMKSGDWKAFAERYRYALSEADPKDAEENNAPPQNTDDDQLRAALEWCRVRRLSIREGLRTFRGDVRIEDAALFARRYAEFKEATGRIDFTDMLERCLERRLARERRVLFIDEAQDLSPLQIGVVEVWMQHADRVYIAGDDDQAIYGFGGAEPDWLIGLSKTYPTDVLDRSWRCPAEPHALAMRIIGRNRRRVPKAYAARDEAGEVNTANREDALADIRQGEPTFVLTRNVRTIRDVVGDLFHARVPYVSERGGLNPLGRAGLVAAVNTAIAIGHHEPVSNAALRNLCEYVPAALIGRRGTKASIELQAELAPDDCDDWNLDALCAAILEHGPASVLTLKIDGETREYLAGLIDKHGGRIPPPTVTVTTIHGSKGREADHVIVFADHAFPVAASMVDDPEPENRAAYVAVTRARKRLTLVQPETRHFYPYPVVGA